MVLKVGAFAPQRVFGKVGRHFRLPQLRMGMLLGSSGLSLSLLNILKCPKQSPQQRMTHFPMSGVWKLKNPDLQKPSGPYTLPHTLIPTSKLLSECTSVKHKHAVGFPGRQPQTGETTCAQGLTLGK